MLNKQKAITLFVNNTNYETEDVISVKQIHNGFTNISFCLLTKDKKKYQVRIGNDKNKVNRNNEQVFLKIIKDRNYLYLDTKSGDAIKKWIDGHNPAQKETDSNIFLRNFVLQVKQLHSIRSALQNKIIKHNFFDCWNKAKKLPLVHRKIYKYLIKKYQRLPLVLSHNDLSSDNLLYTKEHKVIFIDYEWARLNNEYWDYANFIREVDLNRKGIDQIIKYANIKNPQTLYDFIYICTNYAYQWTFNMPQTKKIKQYRKDVYVKMSHYLEYINYKNSAK